MELRHLRYFIAVAEHENVTRAAAQLHVAQPSLSRQIRDLEGELGFDLFEHGAKSLRLTEAGRVFLERARAVVRSAGEAVDAARAVANGQAGELHLGYAPSLAVEMLPRMLRAFQEAHPGVRVQLHDLSTRELLRGLRGGTLHMAVMVKGSARVMADLDFTELERQSVRVAVPRGHPLAALSEVGLKDLAAQPFVAFTLADYPEHHAWMAGLFADFAHPPPIVEEHDGVTSLIAAVEAGKGVALVSERMDCMAGNRLRLLPLRPAPEPLVIGIAVPKGSVVGPVKAFLKLAREMPKLLDSP